MSDAKNNEEMRSAVQKKKYDLAIIGAGPAGMMAALRASECGAAVVLLEKNHMPGIKLLMTGKERCNITNAETDTRKFASRYGKNGKFLLSALYRFGIEETIDFFHKNRLKTKVERGGRVFPESDRSGDVRELFLGLIKENNITLLTNCGIKRISLKQNAIENIIMDNIQITAANYLICTGGLSYPRTGSTGEGYKWARQMGHTVIAPAPALTPVLVRERWVKELEGLSLKNVSISVYQNNKKQDARFGEALFTGAGMSGPIILDMSRSIGKLIVNGQTYIFIDLKPALDFNKLDKRILRDLENHKNMSIKNILPELLPKKLIPVILKLANIAPEKKGHSITKDERRKLKALLKQFPLTIKGLSGFNRAIITSGGVNLKEVDPKTMRSRIVNNLYFAGEILDLDGPTGGYNLQVCWSTGYLAGESAARDST
ncbi:MAG TPA: NAD(P)/FAD-dependent oxidoreductase [Nitrospirae bacterium]|nr:dihydrolipoamide dehydrogenase [bacterium BMS3Abin10]HDO25591.1 NAD(P)/FAD-dependent oxidoreductase [Nitrospirota bacterium]